MLVNSQLVSLSSVEILNKFTFTGGVPYELGQYENYCITSNYIVYPQERTQIVSLILKTCSTFGGSNELFLSTKSPHITSGFKHEIIDECV